MSNENNVFLSPYGTCIKKERLLASGTSLPGSILAYSGGKVVTNTTADSTAPLYVADLSVSVAGAFDTGYNTSDNERVNYKMPQRGDLVRFRVGENTTIVVDDELATSAVPGVVKLPAAAGVAVKAIAIEAVTTGAAETATVIGEVV